MTPQEPSPKSEKRGKHNILIGVLAANFVAMLLPLGFLAWRSYSLPRHEAIDSSAFTIACITMLSLAALSLVISLMYSRGQGFGYNSTRLFSVGLLACIVGLLAIHSAELKQSAFTLLSTIAGYMLASAKKDEVSRKPRTDSNFNQNDENKP